MIVEAHNKLREPLRFKATRILVSDDAGTPLAAVIEHAPGQYIAVHRGDPDFDRILTAMGIKNTAITLPIPSNRTPQNGKLITPVMERMPE